MQYWGDNNSYYYTDNDTIVIFVMMMMMIMVASEEEVLLLYVWEWGNLDCVKKGCYCTYKCPVSIFVMMIVMISGVKKRYHMCESEGIKIVIIKVVIALTNVQYQYLWW